MKNWIVKLSSAVGLLAAVGVASFLLVRLVVNNNPGAIAGDQNTPVPTLIDNAAAIAQEKTEPRFVGDLLGIYIARSATDVPDKYKLDSQLCGSGAVGHQFRTDQAGQLALSLKLPTDYTLQQDSLNTGVFGCDDKPVNARGDYRIALPGGDTGYAVIGRAISGYDTLDVSEKRVHEAQFAARAALVIEPITPDGATQDSYVFFPEAFGYTFIFAGNLSHDQLFSLATLVAQQKESW